MYVNESVGDPFKLYISGYKDKFNFVFKTTFAGTTRDGLGIRTTSQRTASSRMPWTFTFRVTENSVALTEPLSGADSDKHNSKLYRPQKQGPITHGRLQQSLSQRLRYRTFPGFSALRCFLCEIIVFSLSFLGERKIQVQRFNATFQTLFLMLELSQFNRSFSSWQTVFLLLLTLQILSQNVALTFEFSLISIEHR